MFFAKSLVVIAVLAAQVLGHAGVEPFLGVANKAVRNDVTRPSNTKPCGKEDITKIDSSKFLAMSGTSFTAQAVNFNPGRDGSMQFTARVDPTGTGKSFVAATITQNGPLAPPKAGSTAQISVSLPDGTKCTGGASGDLCLLSFKSASGFGNCMVVKQSAGTGTASNKAVTGGAKKKTPRSHPRDFSISERGVASVSDDSDDDVDSDESD
ncbi:hypothetical protein CTheo_6606 [Ceratobasidium theobromae]|uniref:Effector protein n=1 Tax=Ceratobasidium theobromae TaxID=1582974 RepID=A0A5N5QER6_9AGAM|nr:hypothetical protein CTheo_6606 [Ceratobasidium theobromae]